MYWILFIMGAMVCTVIAVLVGGLATPRTHVVTRAIRLPVSADVVWSTIREIAHYHEWRHELEFAEVIDTDQPQPRWREIRTNGSRSFGITLDRPPHHMVAQILDEDLSFRGEWRWEIKSVGDQTTLSITQAGSIGNPVFRFFQTYVTGFTKPIDSYLQHCARHLGIQNVMIIDAEPS